MAQDQTKKEALFNEVKGSLFEYLVAKKLASLSSSELAFHKSLDQNYLAVLAQQDRMVRQFYPEMTSFLNEVSGLTADKLTSYFGEAPKDLKLMGKFSNSPDEADLHLTTSQGFIPVSLKLNKRNAFVNTKSGGIKSFFSQYFSFLPTDRQITFNQLVDLEFSRMAAELHALHELDYPGNFSLWIKSGLSELPGELGEKDRLVLKAYYARISLAMHEILSIAFKQDKQLFSQSLCPLMGFGRSEILQVICFHDFKGQAPAVIEVHPFSELSKHLSSSSIMPVAGTSSVEIGIGTWTLQIRVKPMNKFTTTAIKINCSIKVKNASR